MSEDTLAAPSGASDELSPECADALSQLARLLDHDMPEPDADEVRAHIEACEACTELADVEEHVRALVRRACLEKAPAALRLRIVNQVMVRTLRTTG